MTRGTVFSLMLLSAIIGPVLSVSDAFAVDITIPNPNPFGLMNPHSFTDNRGANPVGLSTGYLLRVGPDFVTPVGPGITGVATQGATTLELINTLISPFGSFFAADIPFDAALTGAWTITLTDASGSVSAATNPIPNPEVIPLVSNILISGPGLTPHISWTLPDLTGLGVNQEQVRVFDVATGINLRFFNLSPTTTFFDIPNGLLTSGKSYAFDVVLDNLVSPPGGILFLQNRSETFSAPFTPLPAVPEPSTLLLLGTGLVGLVGLAWRRHRK